MLSEIKKFENLKYLIVGTFLISIILFRNGCICNDSGMETNDGIKVDVEETDSQKKQELNQPPVSRNNGSYFVAKHDANIYIKPDIKSPTYYYLKKDAEFFVKDLNQFKYFYYYNGGEIEGYVLKESLRRK